MWPIHLDLLKTIAGRLLVLWWESLQKCLKTLAAVSITLFTDISCTACCLLWLTARVLSSQTDLTQTPFCNKTWSFLFFSFSQLVASFWQTFTKKTFFAWTGYKPAQSTLSGTSRGSVKQSNVLLLHVFGKISLSIVCKQNKHI